jgi:hypothetical protein
MNCTKCGHSNPDGSQFCNRCGAQLPKEREKDASYFGVFSPGGYGDGYQTSFGFQPNAEEAMSWQNSPASLSLSTNTNPASKFFLAEVKKVGLLSQDKEAPVSSRWQVLRWWQLVWNGDEWQIGEEVEGPESIGLSPFENLNG